MITELQAAARALIAKHETLRDAAESAGIDAGYLCNLANGKKTNPGDSTLKKLGIEKRITYRKRK